MKKGYLLKRFIRSIISVLIIMTVIFAMVYSLVPRDNIFFNDGTYSKLGGRPDEKREYVMRTWQKLGYLDYTNLNNYCSSKYNGDTDKVKTCVILTSDDAKEFKTSYEKDGYTIEELPISKTPIAYKDKPLIQRILKWFHEFIYLDHPWFIQDENNPDLKRSVGVGLTPSNGPAIKCSGCEHKYLLYFDTHFPFIHQNIINFNLGESYPTFQGIKTLNVVSDYQGQEVKRHVTYETGAEGESGIIWGSLKYKYVLDRMDQNKFPDHYADFSLHKGQQSMIGTSFIMGIFAMILAYGLGLPIGLSMARHKDGLIDKLGMVYIIFIIAVPSLAYIYIFRYIGTTFLGLPSVFTTFGPGDIRSWILPVISLSLPQISSLMMWTRRYVVDQMNSDYVKFAKAKGLSQSEIYRKHIFKNAIIPIAQGIPASLAGCIVGAIITEAIYSVGGMGKMLPDSIKQYNNSMVVTLSFIFSTISIISVLLGDLVLTWIDPRIQLAEKEGRS